MNPFKKSTLLKAEECWVLISTQILFIAYHCLIVQLEYRYLG